MIACATTDVAGTQAVAAEVAALYSVVLGGAVSLPLLAAGGVFLDAASRWLLLSEPPPRQRVLAGGGLATVAAALAAHFAPLPLQLSGDQFWHALHARSAQLVVGLPLAGLLAGEVIGAARLLRSGRVLGVTIVTGRRVLTATSGPRAGHRLED